MKETPSDTCRTRLCDVPAILDGTWKQVATFGLV